MQCWQPHNDFVSFLIRAFLFATMAFFRICAEPRDFILLSSSYLGFSLASSEEVYLLYRYWSYNLKLCNFWGQFVRETFHSNRQSCSTWTCFLQSSFSLALLTAHCFTNPGLDPQPVSLLHFADLSPCFWILISNFACNLTWNLLPRHWISCNILPAMTAFLCSIPSWHTGNPDDWKHWLITKTQLGRNPNSAPP